MPIQYNSHGGSHNVAVVHCPNICRNRLVHLSQDAPGSWIIRDYISRQQLRRSPPPNASFSTLDLAQIEAEVTLFEPPPFHAWENLADWEAYLRLRTMVILGRPGATPPSPTFGIWQPL
ncbi:MAG: hypothetical protein JNK76_16850 [Planctomycetales bacterium]|nr:hypothetical protein [Planctomycetales bacterium]MBN8624928.1 hypothetical protein [Planctomycetota bacterium]